MRPTTLPAFVVLGVTFRAYATADGYLWRSDCGRLRAWRTGSRFEASCDGAACGGRPRTLADAMSIAVLRQRRQAA